MAKIGFDPHNTTPTNQPKFFPAQDIIMLSRLSFKIKFTSKNSNKIDKRYLAKIVSKLKKFKLSVT
jgi:hypothetical protein